MSDIDIKLDGTYPFDNKHEEWRKVSPLSRLMACRMLGVPHFAEHDNGFLNKGYVIVQVSEDSVYAVYNHDGRFSLIRSQCEKLMTKAFETPELVIGEPMREKECPTCGVVLMKDVPCPRCTYVPDSAVDEVRNRFMSVACSSTQMAALTGIDKRRVSHILFAKPHLVRLTEEEHDKMHRALDEMRAATYGADKC